MGCGHNGGFSLTKKTQEVIKEDYKKAQLRGERKQKTAETLQKQKTPINLGR